MKTCRFCSKSISEKADWCLECFRAFSLNILPRVPQWISGVDFPILAATQYSSVTSQWILKLKTRSSVDQDLESNRWVQKLIKHWIPELTRLNADFIVSIPSNPWRVLMERSLSQFIGEEVSKLSGLKLNNTLLTLPWSQALSTWGQQKHFSAAERHLNAYDFFAKYTIQTSSMNSPRILLVDDVCTTGATIRSCGERLKSSGISVVGAFVLSRVPQHLGLHSKYQGSVRVSRR
jgi:predicted amidophosphoribosyltransferase